MSRAKDRRRETASQKAVRTTCAGLRKDSRARERAALTDAEIDTILARAIIEAATDRGAVSEADLARCNVPREALTPLRFRRCLALAREMCPALAGAWSPA
jgi:hypothetical protein